MKKFALPIVIVIAFTAFFSIFIVKEVNQAIVLQKAAGDELFAGSANAHFTKVEYPRG